MDAINVPHKTQVNKLIGFHHSLCQLKKTVVMSLAGSELLMVLFGGLSVMHTLAFMDVRDRICYLFLDL